MSFLIYASVIHSLSSQLHEAFLFFVVFFFLVLLCEGWLVLLSEISHLSVTSLTGQAAIGDCTMPLLLGGFSSFLLFSNHSIRELQENQRFHPCFPPISIKHCASMFAVSVLISPDNICIIQSEAAKPVVRYKRQIFLFVYFHLFIVLSHFHYSVIQPQPKPLCGLGVAAAAAGKADDRSHSQVEMNSGSPLSACRTQTGR